MSSAERKEYIIEDVQRIFILLMILNAVAITLYVMITYPRPTSEKIFFFIVFSGSLMVTNVIGGVLILIHPRIATMLAKPKPPKEKISTRVGGAASKIPLIKDLARVLEKEFRSKLPQAMLYTHPTVYASAYSLILITSLIGTVVTSVILYLMFGNIIVFTLKVVPLIIVAIPFIELRAKISSRKSEINNELPFFLIYAAILQSAGLSLYSAFERLIGKRILPRIEKEAEVVKRDYLFFSHNPVDALDNFARDNPNEKLQTIVLGYTSIVRSGGDTATYLSIKADDELKELGFRWRKYAETASNLGEITIALFLMLPTLIVLMAIAFSSAFSLTILQLYTYGFLPLVTGVIISSIHSIQPKFYNVYDIHKYVPYIVAACIPPAIGLKFIISDIYAWVSITLLILSVPIAIEFYREHSEIVKIEKALPYFLRDITEMRKIGYDIVQAITLLPRRRSYNKVFDKVLRHIASQLELNIPFRYAVERTFVRSWLCRFVFFTLSEIVETGGGSPQVLESLTTFINSVYSEKVRVKNTTRTYTVLGYATPLLLTALMVATSQILSYAFGLLTPRRVEGIATPPALVTEATLREVMKAGLLATALTAFAVGMVIAKIVDFSIVSFIHVVICVVLSLISSILVKA